MRKTLEPCAFCGEPSTGRDHIPPKSVFLKGARNLITVPACNAHNNAKSGDDSKFREFVSMIAKNGPRDTVELWDKTVRNLHRPETLQRLEEYNRNISPLRDGNWILPVEGDPFISTCQRIVRGLYWHEFRERLPLDLSINADILTDTDGLNTGMVRRDVADRQFVYYFGRLDDEPTVSTWLLMFHDAVPVFVSTNVERINEEMHSRGPF